MNSETILTKVKIRNGVNIWDARNYCKRILNEVEDPRVMEGRGWQMLTMFPTDHHFLFDESLLPEGFLLMFILKYGG